MMPMTCAARIAAVGLSTEIGILSAMVAETVDEVGLPCYLLYRVLKGNAK